MINGTLKIFQVLRRSTFSLKAYFIKEQVNNSERTLSRRIDSM